MGIAGETVEGLRFSADGRTLVATGADRGPSHTSAELYDMQSGERVSSLDRERSGVWTTAIAVSPDESRLAVAYSDRSVEIRSADGAPISQRIEGCGFVCSLAFAPGGKHLAAGSPDAGLTVWDAGTGARVVGIADFAPRDVEFTPAGDRLVAMGWDGTARLVALPGGDTLRTFSGTEGFLWTRPVAVSPDGRYIATETAKGQAIWTEAEHIEAVSAMS